MRRSDVQKFSQVRNIVIIHSCIFIINCTSSSELTFFRIITLEAVFVEKNGDHEKGGQHDDTYF